MSRQRKTPAGGPRQRKCETSVSPSYPARQGAVKFFGSVLICGQCALFREGCRKFCSFLGETVRATTECIVDPLSPEFEAWLATEDASLDAEVAL